MDIKVELQAIGGPENFVVREQMVEEPGKGEIRLRHDGVGLNFIDIYQRIGLYPMPLPAILGVEGSGVVEAIGPDVEGVKVGDKVAYGAIPGGYAATRLLPDWRAIKLPADMDTQKAGNIMLRGMTAYMLLTQTYQVKAGTSLLVHAAAGGLGSILTRWAKDLGAKVIGTVGSDQKAEEAYAHGADYIFVGRDLDIASQVKDLTDGVGVDYAIDGIGGTTLLKTFDCVRRMGTVASIGQAAGPISPITVDDIGPVRSLSFARPSVMAFAAQPSLYREAGEAVLKAYNRGILPDAKQVFPLHDVAKAHEKLEGGKTTGSVLLRV